MERKEVVKQPQGEGEVSLGDGEEVSAQGPRPGLLQPLQLNWGHCASSESLLVGLSEWVRLQELVPWIISREPAPPGSFVWRKLGD